MNYSKMNPQQVTGPILEDPINDYDCYTCYSCSKTSEFSGYQDLRDNGWGYIGDEIYCCECLDDHKF